ncbi:type III-D CRISPR-associated protein Csx19 [Hydrogenobaculum acidophilum]
MSFKKMREIKTTRSRKEMFELDSLEKAKDLLMGFDGCFLIGWYEDKIVFDKFDNSKDDYFSQKLINLRIFNQEKEAFIYRHVRGFSLRLLEDKEGENSFDTEYFDAKQILFGTNAEEKDGFIRVFEDRGFYIEIPKYVLQDAKELKDENHYLVLKTRNYIGYLPSFQASIEDVRFLDICVECVKQKGG